MSQSVSEKHVINLAKRVAQSEVEAKNPSNIPQFDTIVEVFVLATGGPDSGGDVEIRSTINYFGVDHEMAVDLPEFTHYGGSHEAPIVRIGSIRERTSFMPLNFSVKVWEQDSSSEELLFEDQVDWIRAPEKWRNGDVWSNTSEGGSGSRWSLKDTLQVTQIS